ncbi:MAG: preprotein translocase subunit SecE [Actinomycetota bacterium]|nr:preprotein translocase subunit SecE [Actinomycetota bacterium]
MNRQTKRILQRQGQLGPDGTPIAGAAAQQQARQRRQPAPTSERQSLPQRTGEYLREVRSELVKVAWPGRPEVVNYTIVVFVTLVLLTAIVFGINYFVGQGVFHLFPTRR